MTQRMYTSTFRFNDSSDSVYNDYDHNDTVYAGEPSPEIDEAWNALLKGKIYTCNLTMLNKLTFPRTICGHIGGRSYET